MSKTDKKSAGRDTPPSEKTIDQLTAAVAETARSASRASLTASSATEKAVRKRNALKVARVRAEAAVEDVAAARAALDDAKAAVKEALKDEKDAAESAAKAKRKRRKAETAAAEAFTAAADARAALDARPLPVETQAVTSADADATAVPSELSEADTGPSTSPLEAEAEALPVNEVPLSSSGPMGETVEAASAASLTAGADRTVAHLRSIARGRGITGYSAMTKTRLLEVLAETAPEDAAEGA